MHHFSLRFSTKILKDCEIMLFQNRKNKIGGSTKFSMKITYFDRKNTLFLIQSWNIFGHVTGNPIWISARHIGHPKLNSHTGVSIFDDRKMIKKTIKNHKFSSKNMMFLIHSLSIFGANPILFFDFRMCIFHNLLISLVKKQTKNDATLFPKLVVVVVAGWLAGWLRVLQF